MRCPFYSQSQIPIPNSPHRNRNHEFFPKSQIPNPAAKPGVKKERKEGRNSEEDGGLYTPPANGMRGEGDVMCRALTNFQRAGGEEKVAGTVLKRPGKILRYIKLYASATQTAVNPIVQLKKFGSLGVHFIDHQWSNLRLT